MRAEAALVPVTHWRDIPRQPRGFLDRGCPRDADVAQLTRRHLQQGAAGLPGAQHQPEDLDQKRQLRLAGNRLDELELGSQKTGHRRLPHGKRRMPAELPPGWNKGNELNSFNRSDILITCKRSRALIPNCCEPSSSSPRVKASRMPPIGWGGRNRPYRCRSSGWRRSWATPCLVAAAAAESP